MRTKYTSSWSASGKKKGGDGRSFLEAGVDGDGRWASPPPPRAEYLPPAKFVKENNDSSQNGSLKKKKSEHARVTLQIPKWM